MIWPVYKLFFIDIFKILFRSSYSDDAICDKKKIVVNARSCFCNQSFAFTSFAGHDFLIIKSKKFKIGWLHFLFVLVSCDRTLIFV